MSSVVRALSLRLLQSTKAILLVAPSLILSFAASPLRARGDRGCVVRSDLLAAFGFGSFLGSGFCEV